MSVTAETRWMAQQQQLGSAPFAPASEYKVWRNVMDYGAKGDGKTDDTSSAISDGQRCGPDCGTSTVVPAVVCFQSGTYLVSSPIIQRYNTQFLGDPNSVPTILAASSFVGLGVITSSPYISENEGWYLNTAKFLRSIRNFNIDIRLTDTSLYICDIHWQVSQATSLENIEFYMVFNSDVPDNTQQRDPNAQTLGSLALVDSIVVNTDIAVESSLRSEKSTNLLQNVAFYNVMSCGYGRVVEGSDKSTFHDGGGVPAMKRVAALTGEA